ncbi:MAG: hypothetical protein LH660_04700 [Phormidesmis sp. CAN_BIN36]|nr:hypothetical protein [Phormidesmis sp. CAN_BIN36]
MQLINVMQTLFDRPPIPFDPNRQSLKSWAKFCLQDRGFKVIYAQNADFAVETNTGEKVYFKVNTSAEDLDPKMGWIVVDASGQKATVIAPM